jgi:hypothetical protein
MSARPAECKVAIVTSDTLVRTGSAHVFWVSVSAGATGGAFQLNDSTDDGGTDLYSASVTASTGPWMQSFDPPITFATGIYVDVPGTNLIVNVGWGP